MAARNYLDTSDGGVLQFARTFIEGAGPDPASLGLTAADVAGLADLFDAYAAALAAARAPATRGPASVLAKNDLRRALIAVVRRLAMSAANYARTTDAQRQALGLAVRDRAPRPVPRPAVAPGFSAAAGPGRTLELRFGAVPAGRHSRRPVGSAGATILTHVGDAPPPALAGWTYQTNTSGRVVTLGFDPALPPGTCVWVTAFFYNPRGEAGPPCAPVRCHLSGAGVARTAGRAARPEGAILRAA